MNPNIKHVNEKYFDIITNERAWMLGLYASDGNVSNNIITLSQSGDNGLKVIQYVKNKLQCDNAIYPQKTYREIAYKLSFSSAYMVKRLQNFHIVKNKSSTLKFPNFNNKELTQSFIRGYFLGDGSIGAYSVGGSKNFLIASIYGNKDFITQLKIYTQGKYIIRQGHMHEFSEIRWNGKNAIQFIKWLYSDPHLYEDHKIKFFHNYLDKHQDSLRYFVYDNKKKLVKKMLNNGLGVMDIYKETKIPFQTIYRWMKDKKI